VAKVSGAKEGESQISSGLRGVHEVAGKKKRKIIAARNKRTSDEEKNFEKEDGQKTSGE